MKWKLLVNIVEIYIKFYTAIQEIPKLNTFIQKQIDTIDN